MADNVTKKVFLSAKEVAALLDISRSTSYKIVRELNDQLKANGFIVIPGRVSRVYLLEKCYGLTENNYY